MCIRDSFRYRIFNADGGEVEQCGNGARCFARFVLDEGLTAKREIRVETASGVIVPRVEDSGQVTVDMGPPRFEPREVPFLADAPRLTYELRVAGMPVEVMIDNPAAAESSPNSVTWSWPSAFVGNRNRARAPGSSAIAWRAGRA